MLCVICARISFCIVWMVSSGEGSRKIGGVHLAGAQELLMCGVHFHKGSSPKESVGKEVRLQFQTVGKRIIPRHEDASVLSTRCNREVMEGHVPLLRQTDACLGSAVGLMENPVKVAVFPGNPSRHLPGARSQRLSISAVISSKSGNELRVGGVRGSSLRSMGRRKTTHLGKNFQPGQEEPARG